jgi:hypothetical protein
MLVHRMFLTPQISDTQFLKNICNLTEPTLLRYYQYTNLTMSLIFLNSSLKLQNSQNLCIHIHNFLQFIICFNYKIYDLGITYLVHESQMI